MIKDLEDFIDAAAALKPDFLHIALLLKKVGVNSQGIEENTALHRAALAGNYHVVEFLLSQGADPNIQNMHGFTPLYLATFADNFNVAKLLMDSGANTQIQSNEGVRPFDTLDHSDINIGHIVDMFRPYMRRDLGFND